MKKDGLMAAGLVMMALVMAGGCDRQAGEQGGGGRGAGPTGPGNGQAGGPVAEMPTKAATIRLVLYQSHFSDVPEGRTPSALFVLDGDFSVRRVEGEAVLALAGQPIKACAVLFGPNRQENLEVTARVLTRRRGRRFSRFGVGLGGVGGMKLRVDAADERLTLYEDDVPVSGCPYTWQSGRWTWLKLRVERLGEKRWRYRGKAWAEGESQPQWMVRYDSTEPPLEGQASVWGTPYAEQTIYFADIRYVELTTEARLDRARRSADRTDTQPAGPTGPDDGAWQSPPAGEDLSL